MLYEIIHNMKKMIVILVAGLMGILILFISIHYVSTQIIPSSLPGVVLQVTLTQTRDYKLALKDILVTNGFPSDYKLNIRDKYYKFNVISEHNDVLFTGTTPHTNIIFPRDDSHSGFVISGASSDSATDSTAESSYIEFVPMEEIILNLPYYKKAKRLVLFDEKGEQKIEIPIDRDKLPVPQITSHRCGDGICDVSENVLTCSSDCQFQLDELKDAITTGLLP